MTRRSDSPDLGSRERTFQSRNCSAWTKNKAVETIEPASFATIFCFLFRDLAKPALADMEEYTVPYVTLA
jgi:hypothetical protein